MTEKYILDFIKAICPESPHLFMAMLNERQAIETATSLIDELRARVAELEQENAELLSRIEGLEIGCNHYRLAWTRLHTALQQIQANRQPDETCEPGCDCSWCVADRAVQVTALAQSLLGVWNEYDQLRARVAELEQKNALLVSHLELSRARYRLALTRLHEKYEVTPPPGAMDDEK